MTDVKLGRLLATLGLDSKQFKSEMRSAERQLRQTSRQLKSMGQSMTRNLTLPLVAAGGAITKVAFDYEREMNRVNALTGATRAEFAELDNQAKQLGKTTAFSASQAAEGMGFLAQAGFEVREILEGLPSTLDLAAAGQVELGRSADIASNALQAFRLETNQMGRVADVLAHTFSTTNVNLEQLAEGMKLVAPTANQLGFSIEEVSSAIGLLGNAGIQGTIAGTSLNQALLHILDTSSKSEAAMERLGVSFMDSTGEMVGLVEQLRQLEDAGADALDIMQIFGVRGGRAIGTLIGQSSELEAQLAGALEASGTAAEIAEKQLEGLVGSWTRFKSAAQGAALEIADKGGLNSLLTSMADYARDVATNMGDATKGTHQFWVKVGVLAAVIGPSTIALGGLAFALSSVVGFFATLGVTTLPGVGIALVALAAAVIGGKAAWDKLSDAMTEYESRAHDATQATADLKYKIEGLSDAAVSERTRRSIALGLVPSKEDLQAAVDKMAADLRTAMEAQDLDLADQLSQDLTGLQKALEYYDLGVEKAKAVTKELAGADLKIAEIFVNAGDAIDMVGQKAEVLGDRFDPLTAKASVLERAIIDILNVEGGRTSEELAKLRERLQQVDGAIKAAKSAAEAQAKATRVAEQAVRKAERAGARFHKILKDMDTAARQVNMDPLVAEFERSRNELIELGKAAGLTGDQIADFIAEWERDFGIANQGVVLDLKDHLIDMANWLIPNLAASFGGLFSNIKVQGVTAFKTLATQIVKTFQGTASQLGTLFRGLFQGNNLQVAIDGVKSIVGAFSGGGGAYGTINRLVNVFAGTSGSAIADENPTSIPGGQLTPNTPAPLIGKVLGYIGGAVTAFYTGQTAAIGAGGELGEWLGGLANNAIASGDNDRVIKAAIGGIFEPGLTFIVSALLGHFKKFEAKLAVLTSPIDGIFEDKSSNEGASGAQTPFGFVGIHGDRSRRLNQDLRDYVVEQVTAFDEIMASVLTASEIELAAESLQDDRALQVKFTKFDNEIAFIIADRMRRIIDTFSSGDVADEALKEFGDLDEDPRLDQVNDIIETGLQWFRDRARVTQLRDDLFNDALEPITEAEKAIGELNSAFSLLVEESQKFGIALDGIDKAYARQLDRLTRDFNDDIAQAILSFTDPVQAALNELAEAQAARLREAEVLGADLVEVERLSALERVALMQQASDSIRELLLTLTATTASPLSPVDVLGAAEERFAVARGAFANGSGDPSELTASASALLDASEAVFASSEMFFQRFDFVVSTLQNILAGTPGFAHGGSFTVAGSGGTDSVIPLFRATPGETVTVTPAGEDPSRASAIASAHGSAEQIDLLTDIADGLRSLDERLELQQGAIVRLAAKAAGAR